VHQGQEPRSPAAIGVKPGRTAPSSPGAPPSQPHHGHCHDRLRPRLRLHSPLVQEPRCSRRRSPKRPGPDDRGGIPPKLRRTIGTLHSSRSSRLGLPAHAVRGLAAIAGDPPYPRRRLTLMPDPTAARRQRERYARKRQGITWEPQLCSGCQKPHRGKHGGLCHECWESTDAGKAATADRVRRSRARKEAAAPETTTTTTGNA
jgi:hypothetical protein